VDGQSPSQVEIVAVGEGLRLVDEGPSSSTPRLQTVLLGGIFAFCGLVAFYVASGAIFPIALAFVLAPLLQPLVAYGERFRLPRAVAALVTILLVAAVLAAISAAITVPAQIWMGKLPQGIPRLETHLAVLASPIESVRHLLAEAEHMADAPGGVTAPTHEDLGLTDLIVSGVRTTVDGLLTTLLVLYFALVSGDTLLRRLVEVLPTFRDKRIAIEVSHKIEEDISVYLATITAMNAGVGVATAAAMAACGVGDALLWGALAFLLNFMPIFGPLCGVVVFLLVGMLSFDGFWASLAPAALYTAIHLIEGEALTPLLLARRFTLNPLLIVLSLLFWFWFWGVPGLILSVPMLAILKIVCDRIEPLKSIGHCLEA
jgi:predicted PurR-regulated permease PerM